MLIQVTDSGVRATDSGHMLATGRGTKSCACVLLVAEPIGRHVAGRYHSGDVGGPPDQTPMALRNLPMTLRNSFVCCLLLAVPCIALGQVTDIPSGFDLPLDIPTGSEGLFDLTLTSQASQEDERESDLERRSPKSRKDLLKIEEAATEVAAKAMECTVSLVLGRAMGSGVVISEDGYILTAAHVVAEPDRTVEVRFPDGRITKAKSLGLHTSADGALCKITEDWEWPHMPLATREQAAKAGDWCVAVGHPGGFDQERSPPVRLGRVIEVRPTVMRTDCPIMGGDSGGPLFDLQGRVIGIHSRISEDITDNLHVPSNAFHDAWDRIKEGEVYPTPIPSKFLSVLDANDDGMLTKDEMKSDYHGRVFERLRKEFGLRGDEISIKQVTTSKFRWRSEYTPDILEISDMDERAPHLQRRDYFRGPVMERMVSKAIQGADPKRQPVSNFVSSLATRVYVDGRRVALGTIVDQDGWILTKASRIVDGELTCRMPDGTRRSAKVMARDDEYDLALLKVSANNLNAPVWNMTDIELGRFVVLPDNGGDVESIGVLSVPTRSIQTIPARMGVRLSQAVIGELLIDHVFENSGAEKAGIQIGDVIRTVDGEDVKRTEDIHNILDGYRAGDSVAVVVLRGEKEISIDVRLLAQTDVFFPMMNTWQMSGPLSRRRDGFEAAFQIDAPLKPQSCGGPVVDLNGHLLGVTLARANRVATYAIGTTDLQPILDRMRSEASAVSTTRLEGATTK